ncbi:hypothetical protein AUP68_06402 [Ilyonectria robusta]
MDSLWMTGNRKRTQDAEIGCPAGGGGDRNWTPGGYGLKRPGTPRHVQVIRAWVAKYIVPAPRPPVVAFPALLVPAKMATLPARFGGPSSAFSV